jgi:hypothetical protein
MLLPYPFYHDKKNPVKTIFIISGTIIHSLCASSKKIFKGIFLLLPFDFRFAGICDELGFGLLEQMHAQGEALANEYPRQLFIREVVEISILLYMG